MGKPTAPPRVLRILTRLNSGGIAGCVLTQAIHGIPGYDQIIAAGTTEENEVPMEPLLRRLEGAPVMIPDLRRQPAPWSDVRVVRRLLSLMAEVKPSIIETHASKAGSVGRVAAAIYNRTRPPGAPRARVLHYFHGHVFRGGYFRPGFTRLFLQMERWLARWATDLILVPAAHQRDELSKEFAIAPADRFRVVSHGMEIDRLIENADRHRSEFRRELGLSSHDLAIGIVGRLEPVKDHAVFLRAAAHVSTSLTGPESRRLRFVIIGDGDLRADLEQLTSDLGLSGAVTFTGHRHDPERFFAGLDIAGLSSRNEGYPFALMEAMAFGRSVFSTAAGGVVDLVRHGETGLIAPVGDPAALGDVITTLVRDPDLRARLGEAARRDMQERHDLPQMIDSVRSVYDELLGRDFRSPLPTRR